MNRILKGKNVIFCCFSAKPCQGSVKRSRLPGLFLQIPRGKVDFSIHNFFLCCELKMGEIKLGRIESVDLRSIWTSEDRHFTPWLAQPENLETLGETLGIELELEAQEKYVGPFRADLLCKNTADDSWILIENQIEKTDHKHLGQLLTYAAGLEAITIVWISAQFCEEHRAALDWLNQKTDESVRFFGLEVELWKIGDSPAAPRFKVISQPNDWANTVRHAATGLMERPSEILRVKYWTAFRSYLQENKSHLKPQKPAANHWV
jgi:hypothetical protein